MNQQYPPPYPPQYVPPIMPHNSTMAIISLISGLAGWSILPFLGSIVAVITGHMAKSEIRRGGGMIIGNGMATWGLVLGYVNIALGVCLLCLFLLSIILPLLGIGLSIPFFNSGSSY